MGFRDTILNKENQEAFDRWYKDSRHAATMLLKYQAGQWIKENLELVNPTAGQSDRCFVSGKDFYKYKDGRPIDQDAIDAVKADEKGQVNVVRKIDEFTIERRWECDSS